jgi:hypothetical protein
VDIDWRWQDLEEKEDCEELAKVLELVMNNRFIRKSNSKRRPVLRSSSKKRT